MLPLEEIQFTTPESDSLSTEYLEIEVRARSGQRICENGYELFVLPSASPAHEVPIFLHDDNWNELSAQLLSVGYSMHDTLETTVLLVSRTMTKLWLLISKTVAAFFCW